jgi:type II secretory pathway pseudopilin PulG
VAIFPAMKKSLIAASIKNKGFSLIEIIVLVSLVGILYSLIFPSFNSINFSFQLLSLTKQIAADLKFTQQGAISSDFPYIITFKENSYNILSTQNGEEKILKSSIFPVGFSIKTNFENNKLNFSIDGNPNRAGSIELSNSKGKTRKIYVSNIGRIRFE